MRQLRILSGQPDTNMPYLHYYYPPRAFVELGHTVYLSGIYGGNYDFAFMQDHTWRSPRPTSLNYPVGHWAIDCDNYWPSHKVGPCTDMDVIFVDTHDWVEKYREFSKRVEWLPFACDPDVHREVQAEEKYDVGFVGLYDQHRGKFLDALRGAGFSVRVHRSRESGLLSWPETWNFIAECRVVFNYSLCTGMNMRLYETLSMGKLLLTNRKGSEPDIFFKDGEHLAVYETPEELVEKARYYLENEGERLKVAKAGQRLVHEKHTYVDRMRFVIKTLLG